MNASLAATNGLPSNATGYVYFFDGTAVIGNATLSSGSAIFETTSLAVGVHQISAGYFGDGNFGGSYSPIFTLTIASSGTSVSISASPNPAAPNQSVTLSAAVSPSSATGTVTFYNATTPLGAATLSSGSATLVTAGFAAGTYSLTAQYGGDSTHPGATSSAAFLIVQASSWVALTSSANPSSSGQSVIFRAAVTPATATGSVQFKDGSTVLATVQLNGGSAGFSIASLAAGTHSITAVYSGDANDTSATSNTLAQSIQNVSSTTLTSVQNPSTVGQSVTFVAAVTPSAATGTVQFLDSGSFIGTATVSGGSATFAASSLAQGTHSITAVYGGDANDTGSVSAVLTQTVNAKTVTTTVLTATPSPSAVGAAVTLAASVSPAAATGTVQFLDGTTVLSTATLAGGAASFTASTLTQGTHSLTAVYSGDALNAGSTSSVVQQVVKATTTTSLVSSQNPITLGGSAAFTASVSPASATGTVQFTVYNSGTLMSTVSVTVAGGVAVWNATNLSSGSNSVTAIYSGDANNAGSTSAAVNEMVRFTSYTVLTSSLNPSTVGGAVVLTATLYPANSGQTGSVQVFNGATSLGSGTVSAGGVAQLSTTTLPAGTNSLTAVYSGDTYWASSTSSAIQQTVNRVTTTSLVSSPNPSTVGGAVTMTATVSPSAATGTVQFLDGTTVLGTATLAGGAASFSLSTLAQGTHSLTAVYSGDSSDAGSTSSVVSQTVNLQSTSVQISTNPAFPTVGQTVSIVAAVTPAAATGAVNFYTGSTLLGTSNLSGGQASFPITTTSAGLTLVNLMAVYQGSSTYSAGSSPSISVNVGKGSTGTTLVSSVNPSVPGQAVTFTATVTPAAATGSVTFSGIGSATVANGVASITTSTLSGATTITASYSGDSNYNASASAGLSQVVKTASATSLASSENPATVGQSITFTATVSPSAATGTVQFLIGSTVLGTSTLSSGVARFSTTALPQGSDSITASYSGNATYAASTSSALTQVENANTTTALSSSLNPSIAGEAVTFTASITPSGATGTVQFLDGSTSLGTATVSAGTASIRTSTLAAGSASIKAVFSGGTTWNGSASAILTQTVKTATTVSLSSNKNPATHDTKVTLTATVTPSAATGTVQFFDGATSLGTASVGGGKATLAVSSWTDGTHSITAVYSGDSTHGGSTSAVLDEVIQN